jgi:hypothetical protein
MASTRLYHKGSNKGIDLICYAKAHIFDYTLIHPRAPTTLHTLPPDRLPRLAACSPGLKKNPPSVPTEIPSTTFVAPESVAGDRTTSSEGSVEKDNVFGPYMVELANSRCLLLCMNYSSRGGVSPRSSEDLHAHLSYLNFLTGS